MTLIARLAWALFMGLVAAGVLLLGQLPVPAGVVGGYVVAVVVLLAPPYRDERP